MGKALTKYGYCIPSDKVAQKTAADAVNRFVKAVEKIAMQNKVADNQ